MKKRLVALFATLALVFMAVSCETGVKGSVAGNSDTAQSEVAEDFSIGVTSGQTYTNEYFDIGLTVDEKWIFKTQEEIAAINNTTLEQINLDTAKQLAESSGFCDMMVVYTDGTRSINVTVQNLGLMGLTMTADDIIEGSLPSAATAFQQAGYTDVSTGKEECTFCGEKVSSAVLTAKKDGVSLYEKQLYVIKGTYFAAITFAAEAEADVDDMLAMFYDV